MRYVDDVAYLPEFCPELAPEWLRLVASIGGFEGPDVENHYRWCDLGCGRGLSAAVLAATRPHAQFVGIDMIAEHIDLAEQLRHAAAIENVSFHALDFRAAAALDWPPFDFIVAHGVYAWIDEEAAVDLLRFIDRHLAPGGLVYVSYNAMPGWAADAPFQHLVFALARRETSGSDVRAAAACAAVQALLKAGAPALQASPVAQALAKPEEARQASYLAHEYLSPAWRPRYVEEVRAAVARIGLRPIGSATLRHNFDRLVLRRAAREALIAFEDDDLRELARDFFLFQGFRRDVYGREVRPLNENARRRRLLTTPFGLLKPPELVDFAMPTEAGRVTFDNPVARNIVTTLARAPASLHDCRDDGFKPHDLVANALTLCCAGTIAPATSRSQPVERLNAALLDFARNPNGTACKALPWGTALRCRTDFLEALRDGVAIVGEGQAWAGFLQEATARD